MSAFVSASWFEANPNGSLVVVFVIGCGIGLAMGAGNALLVGFFRIPAIVATLADNTVAIISEIHTPEAAHARAYFESEMSPMPAAPAAPVNVRAVRGRNIIGVSWNPSADANGFIVQGIYHDGTPYLFPTATGTSTTINDFGFASVRVTAFNSGGVSDPVTSSVLNSFRHRAAH